jgi:CPA2 family monovalent cation:H+ antiporter-2
LFSIVIAGIGVAGGVDRDLGALSATYVLLLAVGGSLALRFADSFGTPQPSASKA